MVADATFVAYVVVCVIEASALMFSELLKVVVSLSVPVAIYCTKRTGCVVEVPAYETRCPNSIPVETINAISNRKIDAMVFSSGKTVSNSSLILSLIFLV